MTNNKPLTPLEKLTADKNRIQNLCREQKKVLNDDFAYLQANASSLLLSSFSSILFPSSTKKTTVASVALSEQPEEGDSSLSFTDMITITKHFLPIVWIAAKPVLISWGIKRAGDLALRVLFGKKKTT